MPRGSGRLGGHVLGVTFVLRDNFWKMFQTTFLARLSFQFGFIDGSVFLGGKGGRGLSCLRKLRTGHLWADLPPPLLPKKPTAAPLNEIQTHKF